MITMCKLSTPKLLVLCFLLCGTIHSIAQVTSYPCHKQIEKGQYEKAYEKLDKQLQKDQSDCEVYYALFKYYYAKDNSQYNLRKAYENLTKVNNLIPQYDEKKQAKLRKNGYTFDHLRQEIVAVTTDAYKQIEENPTISGHEDFLKFYDLAPQSLQNQAKIARNALAYEAAEQVHSISAYKNFINKYPEAAQVPKAWNAIYQLDYAQADSIGTEQAYREHAERYPKSTMVDKALQKADKLLVTNKLDSTSWRSIRSFIRNNANRKSAVEYAQRKYFDIVKKSHNIEALTYASKEWNGALRDSCILLLHDIYANTSTSALKSFYDSFNAPCLQVLRSLDRKMIEAIEEYNSGYYDGSLDDLIILAAPYQLGLFVLQDQIAPLLKSHSWDAARELVASYAGVFKGNRNYQELLRVLSEPYDDSVKSYSISPLVNTKGSEYAPAISADGKTLLFCGRNRDDNIGGEDIFISRKNNKGWGKAQSVAELNTMFGHEFPLSLSADGTTMTLFRTGKIFSSKKGRTGWESPEPLSENINIAEWQCDATLTSDGRAILFAAFSPVPHEKESDSNEHYDRANIFVSLLQDDGSWGKPIELGTTINTPFCDRAPFLHPDMKTLYFSSRGHGSLGNLDVFMSKRLSEDSWTEWSEPVNLGKEINSEGQDCWYKISTDGKLAYFSKSLDDNMEIYVAELPEKLRPAPVATISGKLTDPSGKPVVTSIKWEDLETHEQVGQSQTDPTDGSFFVVLPEGKNYGYYIDDEAYFPVADNIDLRDKNELVQIENNVVVASIEQMVEQQIPMPLNNLFFNTGESILLPSSINELKRVIDILKERPLKIEIGGHTDNVGDDNANLILSKQRADAVRDYLVENGISADLLETKGYGESKPIASNKTEEGRRKNRRVEIKFIKL